jgi:hypothetical protein
MGCDILKVYKDHGISGGNGGSFAMGIAESNQDFGKWYKAENCKVMDGRERRKYGIQNRGLCLC